MTIAEPLMEVPAVAPHRRLIVGIDGSEGSTLAVEWAARQASLTSSSLELHTAYSGHPAFLARDEVEVAVRQLLGQEVTRAETTSPGIATSSVWHEGAPAKVLVEASRAVDLLVVGSRGLGGFRGLVLGSVGQKCAGHAYCPVAVVRRSHSSPDRPLWPPKRIVVGIDGSASSILALEWATCEAGLTGATVVAVMAWAWPVNFGWGLPLPPDINMEQEARTVVHQAVQDASARYPQVAIEEEVVEGHPASALLDASRSADLLVVGSRGHGELVGMVMGSVSEHSVAHADCPVVIMRGWG